MRYDYNDMINNYINHQLLYIRFNGKAITNHKPLILTTRIMTLIKEIAERFLKEEESVNLSNFTSVEDAAAKSLVKFE